MDEQNKQNFFDEFDIELLKFGLAAGLMFFFGLTGAIGGCGVGIAIMIFAIRLAIQL